MLVPSRPECNGRGGLCGLRKALHDPEIVQAMCEDYRAGLGIDRMLDDADRAAGRRIQFPVLVVWALQDDMGELYGDPTEIWREWADDVDGDDRQRPPYGRGGAGGACGGDTESAFPLREREILRAGSD